MAKHREPFSALPTADRPEVLGRLRSLSRFLARALRISGAHTVDFYTQDVWGQLVGGRDAAVSPDSVLAAFRGQGQRQASPAKTWDGDEFSSIFSEETQKLVNLETFLDAAKDLSLPNLGICTSLKQLIGVLRGLEPEKMAKEMKTNEFMNNKKSHEVLVMSQLVDCLANYCGIKQVIDLGSGKGYLSSFLALQYNLRVHGIDSSNTNTHGATERNRKLKKYWRAYGSHSSADVGGLVSEREKERPALDDMKCKGTGGGKLLAYNSGPCQDRAFSSGGSSLVVSVMPSTSKETSLPLAGHLELDENELSQALPSLLKILPADAVEMDSPSKSLQQGGLCHEEKERRKTENIKAKTSKLNKSNAFSPLTTYVTPETDLHDIIADLEDSVLVGLHTCGDLAPTTLRLFAAKPEIKAMCSVGCCYHLLSEEFEKSAQESWGFPMCQYLREEAWCCGRNARMSACLALERVAISQGLPTESLFYRAVLQVIIQECYGVTKSDGHVGKIFSKSSCFLDYVRKSLKKLGLDESKLPDSCIMDYYEKYRLRMNELEAFNMLKVVLAPCIETLILLDRLCYLREQDTIAWSGVVQLFDPVKSPRCYAIIAVKKW
ncbi:methyltransferase-like protein 25 isoform X2 [Rhinatrema bivittatum]|uniref:methyltransferase-like protein 25 isoform X2 n=1 Tax=Rhinatrema bivittatum TaxID=194408 RepID=UPI001128BD0B|nr:methyltransferase-like protein 25 isoform X2 [Rhinatrema bivittatum]